ncbi:MAG: type I methionyl aminopeptidase [Leptospiraceae bacterium]|nr:type I methionyl aminopeptidase [Leptospiraceae bacterium]MCB1314412.1 type I methionyl aminopeptidase [Leptospiraceae bacterium]MCB1321877.1 type I methionyl aminopeptidase [Leptospiraceae bacterium]
MSIENEQDLRALQHVGRIVAETIRRMLRCVRPGITTAELDRIGEEYFSEKGARSAPRLSYNFPGATCISVNEEIAHGIPGKRRLKAGDLINIDVSLELDGYYADSGATMCVQPAQHFLSRLCDTSRQILNLAIHSIKAGSKLNVIGKTIQTESQKLGYTTILNLAGHGVGRSLHEEPLDILNYYNPSDKRLATNGMVIAIETFISTGATLAIEKGDGWTLTTADRSYVAQFEHSIVVTEDQPIILTA